MSRAETLPPCSDYCAWETQPAAAPPSAEGGGCEGGSAKGEAAAALRAATAARKAAAAAMPPPPPKRLAMVWGVSETTRHTVRALLRARGGWAFTRDPRQPGVALQWASPPDIFWDSVLSGESVANHAPARSGLVRKAELARNLQRADGGCPSPLPLTYTSFEILAGCDTTGTDSSSSSAAAATEGAAVAFIARVLPAAAAAAGVGGGGGGAWVLKASESSNGAAVLPFAAEEGVPLAALRELLGKGRPWLLQRYVDRPLLARNGRKTHCRGYVLVVGSPDPDASVYLHKDLVPVFLSAEKFSTQ
jgi:hypothetical protein